MNQFTFILKDANQKAFNSFFLFLYFLHIIAVSVIIINTNSLQQKKYAVAIFIILLFVSASFYFFKNKFKQYYYQLIIFVVMICFWFLQSAWLPAIILATVIAFALIVLKTKSTALFTIKSIVISRSVLKKTYCWDDVEHVVLKDHLLTVDFKNNHLLQVEIAKESFDIKEETFNLFCRLQLTNKN